MNALILVAALASGYCEGEGGQCTVHDYIADSSATVDHDHHATASSGGHHGGHLFLRVRVAFAHRPRLLRRAVGVLLHRRCCCR